MVLHAAKSGRLILKPKINLVPGAILHLKNGRKAAKVTELLGPVKSPYASAIPLTDRLNGLSGETLYMNEVKRR